MSLYRKIILLNVLIIVFGGCFFIVNTKLYIKQIETTLLEIDYVQKNINQVHFSITKLLTLGESVIEWNNNDYNIYRHHRLKVDSALLKIKSDCVDFVYPLQIDSLCLLLEKKEMYLLQIMKVLQYREMSDSILINELPIITKRIVETRNITSKKKGITGLFGKKETTQIPFIMDELSNITEKFVSDRIHEMNQIEIFVALIRLQNIHLNKILYDLFSSIDTQISRALTECNLEIIGTQQESFRLLMFIMCFIVVLILISFFIIRFDLCKEEKIKFRLQQTIRENENLLDIRKKIILTVSHDIRGPLGNIHNCADLALETRQKVKRNIYLEDIKHSCEHVLHLVNDLMDAYRINESGDLRNETPFYLDRFLKRISDEFSRKANIKTLIFYPEHENSSFIVKGDADKLEQILDNLLTNAIKFTPSGSIDFRSKYNDGKLLIEIKDTGIGMDEETLKRIFAPFERAAQNVNSEGFGLGLFLTKGLVKVLDGTMEVDSKPGEGSIFKLEFPLSVTDELVEEEKSEINQITILPKNVLIVDDDKIQLKIAEDMLERKGISCTTCINVKEVILALGESYYDMILTDVQMPETDGFGLLKLLRNSDIGNSKTIPVAVMTARGDGNTGIYEEEGFAGCIHKPFNIHSLLTFLSTVMSQTIAPTNIDFELSGLLENTDDYRHILSLVVMESEKEIEELKTAIKTTNRESMRKTIHRMMPVWEMLGKEQLLRNFQEKLHDMDISDEVICENAIQIIEWIEKLIEEAENELKKYENTDS